MRDVLNASVTLNWVLIEAGSAKVPQLRAISGAEYGLPACRLRLCDVGS
jgi:hypothetical protein